MGKKDNRRTPKMLKRKAQKRKQAVVTRKIAESAAKKTPGKGARK